jgi:CheY-like chemotaxis protein
MAEEVRSRIFDPFFTTKGNAGMGLGLAVSYGIVRRHDGHLEVQSQVMRGTCFRISLPIAKYSSSVTSEPERPMHIASEASADAIRILVVDDEDCITELLKDILEKEKCSVSLAADGHKALSLFEASKYDAVFTDLGMPGMSGWELARAIRERDRQVPLAIITGWGEAVGSTEQNAAEVHWVVAKPFDNEQIVNIVREISHQRNAKAKPTSLIAA